MRPVSHIRQAVSALGFCIVVGGCAGGCEPIGRPPVISSVVASETTVQPGGVCTAVATAEDLDGDTLSYAWTATAGVITGTGAVATWTAPATAGDYTITCTVSDGHDQSDSADVQVAVRDVGGWDVHIEGPR